MVRAPFFDKNGLKKGAWSQEEDDKLRAYVQRYGHWNWRQLPKFAGLSRCGKSCRLRWMNYLRPGVRRGNYCIKEEDLIIKLREQMGNNLTMSRCTTLGRSTRTYCDAAHTMDYQSGLNLAIKHMVDAAAGGSLSSKTLEQA
eukprot:XP_015571043.1 transcription factor MYB4-like [Ricinus communis]